MQLVGEGALAEAVLSGAGHGEEKVVPLFAELTLGERPAHHQLSFAEQMAELRSQPQLLRGRCRRSAPTPCLLLNHGRTLAAQPSIPRA